MSDTFQNRKPSVRVFLVQLPPVFHLLPRIFLPPQHQRRRRVLSLAHLRQQIFRQRPTRIGYEIQKHFTRTFCHPWFQNHVHQFIRHRARIVICLLQNVRHRLLPRHVSEKLRSNRRCPQERLKCLNQRLRERRLFRHVQSSHADVNQTQSQTIIWLVQRRLQAGHAADRITHNERFLGISFHLGFDKLVNLSRPRVEIINVVFFSPRRGWIWFIAVPVPK